MRHILPRLAALLPALVLPALVLAALVLTACAAGVQTPGTANLGAEALVWTPGTQPTAKPGECWGSDVTPAVIETITEQDIISPEVRDEAGNVITPATYRSTTRQRMVQDRTEVWFRTPCPEEQTPEFIASLQRALKARGLYLRPLSGEMDSYTAESVRRFQAARGLDSPVLSLAAAKDLGLTATAREDL